MERENDKEAETNLEEEEAEEVDGEREADERC